MDNKKTLKLEEVCILVGVSAQTLNTWYRFKKINPESEYAKMLPDYEQSGLRGQRFWGQDDIYKLIQFKNAIPRGRTGVLGEVTQKYVKKRRVRTRRVNP